MAQNIFWKDMEEVIKKVQKDCFLKLDLARWWLLENEPFYGALATELKDVLDGRSVWKGKPATACTDGRRIYWSVPFLLTLDTEETRGVLLHEVFHCTHGHFWRLPRNEKGNRAGDFAINQEILKIKGIKLPQGALLDPSWGEVEEEIYLKLPDDPSGDKGVGDGSSGGPPGDEGGCGSFMDPDEGDQPGQPGQGDPKDGKGQIQQSLKERWEQAIQQADLLSRTGAGAGTLPGDLRNQLQRARAVEIDWKRETADFIRDAVSFRNDWSRASRRNASQPVIYPRKKVNDIGVIYFGIDSSGSVSDEECALALACVTAALAETGCSGVKFDIDAEVTNIVRIEPGNECPLERTGYGGTCFAPGLRFVDQAVQDGERVAGLIYFTDGDNSDAEATEELASRFQVPLLWVIGGAYSRKEPMPYGRTLFMPKQTPDAAAVA